MTDPANWLRQVDAAQERLLDTAREVTDEQARRPSLLPGWTVGHVLTHIARNADSLVNLATWASTGVKTPQYRSDEARDDDIQAGANRPASELLEDVAESNKRISAALADVPADKWDYVVQWRGGAMKPAGVIPSARLTEVEIHHADMGLAYSYGDIPEDFRLRLLRDAIGGLPDDVAVHATDLDLTLPDGRDATTVITGTSGHLLGWATGRTSGDGLDCPGGLPDVPEWR